jgi:membrane-bound lytic murein transglycosylase D
MRWLVLVAICTSAAYADPPPAPVHPGPQALPPVRAGDPVLAQDLNGRKNVRGCPVGEGCLRPADTLREFELESFPPPGSSPWFDERTPPRSRVERIATRKVSRPSELRPDQPWLDRLEMPDLPVTWTQRLIDYLLFYKSDPRGHAIMQSWLAAQGRYRDLIVSHLRAAHLPEDLLYDAMIESSYDPEDKSSVGALGIWQFMPEGGRIYGLREDHWVDERRDPLRSTIAVVGYWQDLHQRFGNWEVALAAFSMGYGAMLRAIARYNTNDYYQLCELENGLPWESCLYTPKVLAAAIVGHNRGVFGFDAVKEAPAETWEEVAVPVSASLAVIARAAGANEADIKRLNPQLRRGRTPPGETAYIVRVPPGGRMALERKLLELQSDWAGYDAYVVAHGERLEDVAMTYGTTLAGLKKLNGIDLDTDIDGGTVLVVPRISEEQRAKNRTKAKAKLLGSGVDQKDGEPLLAPVPDKAANVAGKKRVFYRVVVGDTLGTIAKALDIKRAQLVDWNGLDEDVKLQPRLVLQAWVAPDFDPARHDVALLDDADLVVVTRGSAEHLDLAEARTGRVRTEYVANGKEKLADVAKKYGMGSHDLARINRISYDTVLENGQRIIVYEVADPSRSSRADEQWKKMSRARGAKPGVARASSTTSAAPASSGDDDATGPVTRPTQLE